MEKITVVPFENDLHRTPVMALWTALLGNNSPHNQPAMTIDKKLAMKDGLLFVALVNNTVVGTVMAGYDGHRGWIYSLAVDAAWQRRGIGSQLVIHAERALAAKGCVKINLQIGDGNERVAKFYLSLGYAIEKRLSMGKRVPENITASNS